MTRTATRPHTPPEPPGVQRSAGSIEAAPSGIPDVLLLRSTTFRDDRGMFYEGFHTDSVGDLVGHPVPIRQVNFSVSHRGVARGIHSAVTPPGQAKIVSCVRGSVIDIAVDLRVGSPTFGQHRMTTLDPHLGVAVYLGEGIGHAFVATADDACVNYLCSTTYVPEDVITVSLFDPRLALPLLFATDPILSPTDAHAPTLDELQRAGRLPTWDACRALHESPGEP